MTPEEIRAEAEYVANLMIRGENVPPGYVARLSVHVQKVLDALQDKNISLFDHDEWLTKNGFWEDVI